METDKDYYVNNASNVIFSIHCLRTNQKPVTIIPVGGGPVTYPPHSFINGAVYHILVKSIIFDPEDTGFVGYQLSSRPFMQLPETR